MQMHILARAFVDCIRKAWMWIKTWAKPLTYSTAIYVSIGVQSGRLYVCVNTEIACNAHIVEEPGFKNVKNKHLGMPPF